MGAALWLKADENLELYQGGDGVVVKKWKSKVGGLVATQSSNESARIEGNQTTPNNKNAIFFPQGNATGGYGYFEIPNNFNLKNSTVLVSLKLNKNKPPYPRVLSFSANGSENDAGPPDALALMFYRDRDMFRVESEMGGNPDHPHAARSPTYNSGNWTVLSYRISEDGNMTVSLDKNEGDQSSNPNMAAQNSSGKTRIGLGDMDDRDAQNLAHAHIHEILIFNKYLENDQYAEVQSYMQESMDAMSVQINPLSIDIEKGSSLIPSILGALNASSNGDRVEGNFAWKNPDTVVTQSGNHTAIFQPTLAKYSFLEFEIFVMVKPELNTSTDLLTGFRTRNGTASPSKSLSINGTNLTSNVTASVLSGSGFEVSTDNSTFGSNATIAVVSGNASALLYVRLAAAQTSGGNKTASLNIPFGAAPDESVRLEGTVVEVFDPYIEVIPYDLTLPVTTAGTPSASANFTVNAYNLPGNLTANATAGLEISLGNGTFSQTLEIPIAGGDVTTSLNLRVAASAIAGALSGSVTLTSGNTTASLAANGTVNAPIQRTLPAPAPTPENSKTGKKIKKQKLKKKPKKKKKSLFTFPQVVATSGSTWITADGKVVSENQQPQSNTSK